VIVLLLANVRGPIDVGDMKIVGRDTGCRGLEGACPAQDRFVVLSFECVVRPIDVREMECKEPERGDVVFEVRSHPSFKSRVVLTLIVIGPMLVWNMEQAWSSENH
jgi:hypothetical protein